VIAVLLVTGPALADTSLGLGIRIGGVVGHGPLADRLDPVRDAGLDVIAAHDAWAIDAGVITLDDVYAGDEDMAPDADALGGFGWSAGLRWHRSRTRIGTTFVGAGFTGLRLSSARAPYVRRGRAIGPKITAGMDYVMNVRGRRIGMIAGATYQWLFASFDTGERSYGGFAGIDLTIVTGFGTCAHWTATNCER